MPTIEYSPQQIIRGARFSPDDLQEIQKRRRDNNRLGFAYQLAFVRLSNRFPAQKPFEIVDDLLTYVSVQLDIPTDIIEVYRQRRQTIGEHRIVVLDYLNLRRFGTEDAQMLDAFLFEEACRLEQTGTLLIQAKQFLRDARILFPANDTLLRLIARQRQAAREHIFARIATNLSSDLLAKLDNLLLLGDKRLTLFQLLKRPPGKASAAAMLRLGDKLEQIQKTSVLTIDLSWLNNNYQRSLSRYAHRCSADRLRQLRPDHRYAAIVCFLRQVYPDTIDYMIDMHDKLMTSVYKRAQTDIDEQNKKQSYMIRSSLSTLRKLGKVILNDSIQDKQLRKALLQEVDKVKLSAQMEAIEVWLTGKYSHVFNLVLQRFGYLRQFAPTLLHHLQFHLEESSQSSIVEAVQLLQSMNRENKRKLPEDVPLGFISKKIRPLLEKDGQVSKSAWECALLTAIRDEIRAGNIYVRYSKRFGRFDDFFISDHKWETQRENFFKRAGLPMKAEDVPVYLTNRLNQAYDRFLELLPQNSYARVTEDTWQLSVDPSEKLNTDSKQKLNALHIWLSHNLHTIKLPELLIAVDNDLHFTNAFLPTAQKKRRKADQVCTIIATIMAHGCNVGPYTMSQLTEGITYRQIKHITDWQLTEEAQRQALAQVVKAIHQLDVTQVWGEGKTSSSDGQRFRLKRKLLQQTYSHRFHDYAIEFYSFVADNYAPFYSTVIECTDRDAAYVLDGLLYNESDLALEEHYTDTHGYTEINFAAFAMLGRRFAPRIRGLHKQRIYRINKTRDYGALLPLVKRQDRSIHMDWICEQWDRMGQFYASLENGHTTASTALKRLASYSGRNHFYRANRELGRIFKTEYVLQYMSDPLTRKRVRRGLLKGEEVHALARQVSYGKQGRITARDLQAQKNTSNCLTLVMACIIYWQAKEITRVIRECESKDTGIDLTLLEHISPVAWENIILYGEYVLNRNLVQP